jgi:hypothetical protein
VRATHEVVRRDEAPEADLLECPLQLLGLDGCGQVHDRASGPRDRNAVAPGDFRVRRAMEVDPRGRAALAGHAVVERLVVALGQ